MLGIIIWLAMVALICQIGWYSHEEDDYLKNPKKYKERHKDDIPERSGWYG